MAVTLARHGTVATEEGADGDRDEGPGLAPSGHDGDVWGAVRPSSGKEGRGTHRCAAVLWLLHPGRD